MRRARSLCRGALAFCLAGSAALAAPKPSVEITAPGYRIITAVGERAGRDYVVQLDRFRRLLEASLGVKRTPSAIETRIVLASAADWKQTLAPRERVAGFWSPSRFENFLVVDGSAKYRETLQIIFHEYSHDFMQTQLGRDYPAWWDEGFADFMSNAHFSGSRAEIEPAYGHLETIKRSPWIPMQRLLAVDRESPEYLDHELAASFYAQSWLIVHYGIVTNRAFGDGLMKLLRTHGNGEPPAETLPSALGMDFAALDELLRAYARQPRWQSAELEIADAPDPVVAPPRPLAPAEAKRLLAEVALEVGDPKRALPLLDALLAEASEPRTLAMRALAAERAGQPDAEAWLERASAAAPEPDTATAKLLALTLLARAEDRIRPGEPIGDDAASLAGRSRLFFDLALQRAPDDLEAIWGFGLTSYYVGSELERASERVAAARERGETSAELASTAALLFEQLGDLEAARDAWRATIRFARFPELRAIARERLIALASEG